MSKVSIVKRIVLFEVLGFTPVILFLWLDEVLDIPHYLLGVQATPINWAESAFESALALALIGLVVLFTLQFLKHIKYLEGFLLFCASCKRVRCKGKWIPVDVYVRDSSEAQVTHGLCPACIEQYCGGWDEPHKNFQTSEGDMSSMTDDMHFEACGCHAQGVPCFELARHGSGESWP